MATGIDEEALQARFEDLTVLEDEFDDVELEIIRKTNALTKPLYAKRAAIAAKLPHFWPLVFEQCPPELDQHIQPSDSRLFGDSLDDFSVSRFEINDPAGSPRSFSIKFTFAENEHFEDTVLEKKFWYRRGLSGWEGLVSEPVKVHWKEGMDLTAGLTDAAVRLWEAREKLASSQKNGSRKENVNTSSLPEHQALLQKIHLAEESSLSFFTWFGFVSGYKYVGAAESALAMKEERARREKRKKGEAVEDPEENEEEGDEETEVFPAGEELATILAEELWPGAIKYFKSAHEQDDEELSDLEVEDLDDSSDDEIDIRGLVGKGKKDSSNSPPPKKRKT